MGISVPTLLTIWVALTAIGCGGVLMLSWATYRMIAAMAPEPLTIFGYGAKLTYYVFLTIPDQRVWLALGALLLLYGVWRHMQGARIASGLFVLAATLKIFLYDMSGLEGLMRALSFIGLGLVLIGIGLLYQKLVFARRPPAGGDAPDVV